MSVTGGIGFAHAYDIRVDPNAARRAEIRVNFSEEPRRTLSAIAVGEFSSDRPRLPSGYASAMTWYRVTLANGYTQPPMIASPWPHDEQLPEPLHWAWVADNGDLVTKVGRGIFELSFANSRSNWYRELDCRLLTWPGGNADAPLSCNDGTQRTLQIPGNGIVLVDDVPFVRVFESEETALPPEETLAEIMARQGLDMTASVGDQAAPAEEPAPVEENVPRPRPRPANP